MAMLDASLGILIALHVITGYVTIFRVAYRFTFFSLWIDDALAVVTACTGLPMLSILIVVATKATLQQAPFHMALSAYFFVLWTSRATMAMSTCRLYFKNQGIYIQRFAAFTTLILSVGITYGTLAARLCLPAPNCSDLHLCFCYLPSVLAVCAFISDVLVDTGMVTLNWYLFAGLKDSQTIAKGKKRLLFLGLSSSLCTLAINIAFWVSYMAYVPGRPFLFLCLANAVAITSIISSNMLVILGMIGRTNVLRQYPLNECPDFLTIPATVT